MYCVVEQSQRDEVFQAVWLTIFQAGRNKPERTEEKSIVNEDIATVTLNNQQYYISIHGYARTPSTIQRTMSAPSPTQTKNE